MIENPQTKGELQANRYERFSFAYGNLTMWLDTMRMAMRTFRIVHPPLPESEIRDQFSEFFRVIADCLDAANAVAVMCDCKTFRDDSDDGSEP